MEDTTNRRQFVRMPYQDDVTVRQKGKKIDAKGIDLSSGGIGFFSAEEPDRFSSLDVIVLRGAISIPGAMRTSAPANGEGYRVSVAFDSRQEDVFSVLTDKV